MRFQDGRTIGLSDYSVLEGSQRIGRIRLATERMPCVWLNRWIEAAKALARSERDRIK